MLKVCLKYCLQLFLSIAYFFVFRIEYLDKVCRDLKILYLQSNLIAKIGKAAAVFTTVFNSTQFMLPSSY